MPFDRVGKLGRAIEHHAERIVELPEVGIVDQLAGVFRRDEVAHRDVEAHDDERKQRPSQHLDLSLPQRLAGAPRSARFEVGARWRPSQAQPLARHWPRRVGGFLDDACDLLDRGAERFGPAVRTGRDDQRQNQPAR
jgi:hypothetical protein